MSMFGYIGYGYGYDPLWLLFMLPGMLLGIYAQIKLTGAYSHYTQVPTSTGISGAEAAREVLDSAGLTSMPIEMVDGHLTDHYDPMKKALFLSEENYNGRSLAAVGVAAHEAGHALQHRAAYFPLHLRMALVPVTNIATQAAFFISIAGIFLGLMKWLLAGIIIYSILFFFQLVTLPVEFDASSRAKVQLEKLGLIHGDEEARGVRKVLSAAAMTYVAAMIAALFQLLYFVLRFTGSRERE
jgi:Zn-dependent membrane protease YugP